MASPTAIPHPETSAHHRAHTTSDVANESSFKPSRPSYSPPSASSIYSRATGAFSKSAGGNAGAGLATSPRGLQLPLGMSIGRGLPSPPSAGTGGSPPHHNRARSQTTICAVNPKAETFDDRLPATKTPGFFDSAGRSFSGSSQITSSDLNQSRSPTSPACASSAGSGAFQSTYALGRVPSLPLGTSYEQAQKRLNSGSWNQSGGWSFGSLRNGASQAYSGKTGEDSAGGGDGNRGVGGLLRRFSLGGSQHQRSPDRRYSVASTSDFNASTAAAATPRADMPHGHGTRDSGVGFPDDASPAALKTPPAQQTSPRGRQGSLSGSGKRKPSPMGERLLMGHFNAH